MKLFELYHRRTLVEYKRDITAQRFKQKIEQAAQHDRKQSVDEVLAGLEAMDPTPNKKYTEWLTRQYIARQFKLEDYPWVHDILTKFNHVKNKLPTADINRYTFHSLNDEIDKIYKVAITSPDEVNTDKTIPGAKILYKGPLGRLYQLETEEASCELGRGTKWCTAATKSDNMFSWYNAHGSLYIWIDKDGQKYQFFFSHIHAVETEFMDSRNRPINSDLLKFFITKHPVLKQLFIENLKKTTIHDIVDICKDLHIRIPEIESEIAKHPDFSLEYALNVVGNFPEGEPAIATDPDYSVQYAQNVLHGRFALGEPVIAKDRAMALFYADHIIEGRFPEAEPTIAEDARSSVDYAMVLGERFPAGESIIADSPKYSYVYALDILHGPWSEGEDAISRSSKASLDYARFVLHGRFKKGEKAISQNAHNSLSYAKNVLFGRFPEGEEAIAKDSMLAYTYAKEVILGRFPEGEEAIAKDSITAYHYARSILHGRFPAAEKHMETNSFTRTGYNQLLQQLGIDFQL